MHSAEQVAQAVLEGFVAMGATQTTSGPEISQSAATERALDGLAAWRCHLLMDRLQEVVDLGLRGGDGCLDAAFSSALLAQMQLSHPAPFDFRELDYSLAIFAQIANHLHDYLIYR